MLKYIHACYRTLARCWRSYILQYDLSVILTVSRMILVCHTTILSYCLPLRRLRCIVVLWPWVCIGKTNNNTCNTFRVNATMVLHALVDLSINIKIPNMHACPSYGSIDPKIDRVTTTISMMKVHSILITYFNIILLRDCFNFVLIIQISSNNMFATKRKKEKMMFVCDIVVSS